MCSLLLLYLIQLLVLSSVAIAPPEDWQTAIDHGDMLFASEQPKPWLEPSVGNGFLAMKVGPDHFFTDTNTSVGGLFLAGVFNGHAVVDPVTTRAELPALLNVGVQNGVHIGAALDMAHASVLNRTYVPCDNSNLTALVETKVYAHAAYRNLLVLEVNMTFPKSHNIDADVACTLNMHHFAKNFSDCTDFKFDVVSHANGEQTVLGTTLTAETNSTPVTQVALKYNIVPYSLNMSVSAPFQRFLFVAHSSLENEDSLSATTRDFAIYTNRSAKTLWNEHVEAWQARTLQSGIEVTGNLTIAASMNSSLYYIHSAFRPDFAQGLSPGGLAFNSYNGHSFWDCETWMLPPLLLLDTVQYDSATSLLRYRLDRLEAARSRAAMQGFKAAAIFPWESAHTGADCTPPGNPAKPNLEGQYEIHISADIVLAIRQVFLSSRNETFLKEAWPLIRDICSFWSQRVTQDPTSKNYTCLDVQPPDEHAGVVNSSIYTNVVAGNALNFGVYAGNILQQSVPSNWSVIASHMYLPMTKVSYEKSSLQVHAEFENWPEDGQSINQADVALLQYPLGMDMSTEIAKNDLLYYAAQTPANGFYTGQSSYAIAWLQLGIREEADAAWSSAFAHMDTDYFNVWKETTDGTKDHYNFITGAGGYLQNMLHGYGGFRITEAGLECNPVLPPYNVSRVTFRNVVYQQTHFTFTFDAKLTTVVMTPSNAQRKQVAQFEIVDGANTTHSLPATLPNGPLRLAMVSSL